MSDRPIGIPGDHVVHDDQVFASEQMPKRWHIDWARLQDVWDAGITGETVTIAINDTGYRAHPDLPEVSEVKDFTRSRNGSTDYNGHGAHCAGIALGRNGLGVAPGARLVVAKVLGDSGSGSTTGINAGRIWAAENGADVISESLGDGGGPPIREDVRAYEQAYEAGVSVCVAALGNAGYRGSNTVGRPGSYQENLGIGAIQRDGTIANFSSGGPTADLATPGQNIISCNLKNGYVGMSGTSMATPFMAGLCALVICKRRMAGYSDLRGWSEWRQFFSDPRFLIDAGPEGHDPRYGYGIPVISKIINYLLDTEWI